MIQVINVTNEYYENRKQIAEIIIPSGFDLKKRNAELETVKTLKDEFGGKVELLNAINIIGYKNPDFIWGSNCWEIKSVSTKNSIDSQVRYALKQISKRVGGIVLIIDNCILTNNEIIDIVCNRVRRTSFQYIPKVDVILMRNYEVIDIIRLVKKDIPSTKSGQR